MKNNVNRALRAKNNFNLFNRSEAQKNTLCASVNISNASPRRYRDVTETLPRRYGWVKLAAALTLLLTLGVGQMWGGASWIGNSFIVVGDTWYNASGTGQLAGAFNGKNLGNISSLSLGGEIQTYGQSDGAGNPARMHYQFDNGSSTYITLYWFKYANNNNYFHSNSNGSTSSGNAFATNSISLSGLAAGSHKLKVWFEQPDGNQWDSNGGSNYVADFTLNPVVTFKANGGTGSDYTQSVTYNTNTTLTSNTFSKTGYDFAGWATSADGSVTYTNGATVKLTAHTTLYAKWTAKSYSITYKDQGNVAFSGTNSASLPSSYTYGVGASLVPGEKAGYSFGGWYTASDCSTGLTTSISTSATGNKTFYAKWTLEPGVTLSAASASLNIGQTVRLTATGSNASNITKYDFYEGSTIIKTVTTTATSATYDYTPTTTGSKTMKVVMTYNSGSNTVTSSNVVLSINTPSVATLTEAGSTTEMWIGENPTGALTFSATSNNVGSGASVTWSISDASSGTFTQTGAGSYSGKSWTYTPASTGAKTITVTMNVGGQNYTKTYSLTVYERWNIYVRNNCNWANGIALYFYGNATPSSWPGVQGTGTGCEQYTSKWWKVTLDSKYTKFILDNNVNGGSGEEKLVDNVAVNKATYGANTYWDFLYSSGDGPKYYTLQSVSLSDPTVEITNDSYMVNTTMLFATGHITNYGGDGTYPPDMLEVGFKIGETEYPMTCMNTDNHYFWGYITGLTPGTSYTVKAYAKNIHGTGVSSNSKSLTTRASGTYTIQVQVPHNAAAPYIYAYTDVDCGGVDVENAAFPGIQLGSKVATGTAKDWWEYSMPTAYNNFIISNGNSSNQTRAFNAPQEDKCYWYDPNGGTDNDRGNEMLCPYLEPQLMINTPGAPTTFNYYEMSTSPTISKTMTLAAKSTYKFKIVYGAEWYGKASSPTLTRASNTLSGLDSQAGDEDHIQITTDAAGNYTFTFTAPGTIEVTYPTAYTITFDKGTGGATITATGSASGSLESGNYVAQGENVTFTQTATTGYTFTGWYTTKDTGGSPVSEMSTSDNVLDNVTANKTVYSRYSENMTTVTLVASPTGKGTFTSGGNTVTSVTAGKTTKPSVTAVPATGYRVNTSATVWTKNNTNITLSSTTANPVTVTGCGTANTTATLTATFTPKQYTITLNNHGATTTGTTSVTATFDANTNISSNISVPGKTGYAFGGYWTGENGTGTMLISASGAWQTNNAWINSTGKWVNDGNVELHAKWTANPYTVSFNKNGGGGDTPGNITVTYDAPYGTLPAGPTPPGADQFVGWFTAQTGGTQVTSSTIVSTASDHTLWARFEHTYTVTVQYKCGSDVLRAQTTTHASETSVAAEITAPDVLGYEFVEWMGSNATFADPTSASTTVNVTSATTIVANYEVVPMVYFKNNLDWDSVFVSFDAEFVTAGIEGQPVPKNTGKPYYKMTQLGKTDVFYCVIPETYTASNYASWAWNIAFDNKGGFGNYTTTHTGNSNSFWKNEFLGRADFDPNATMYIPYSGDAETRNEGTYYPTGCWLQYNTNYSGYKVCVWNNIDGNSGVQQNYPGTELRTAVAGSFEFKATVWITNSATAYGMKLYKDKMKNTHEIWYTNVNNAENTITSATTSLPWSFQGAGDNENWQRCRFLPEVSGDYIFTVSFATGRPMVDIEYPVTVGDFRLVYKDQATWNNTHDASWQQISPVFKHKANRVDTASFFVSVGSQPTPTLELQKCTDITAGVETWTKQSDVSLSSISEKGVYNFTVTQSNDASSATAAYLGAYSGNYYIRTDASDGGWNNYKSTANAMTYTEYSMDHGGSSGPYSHYFMRHVNNGQNIKFVVANDYSACLTDTLIDDTYAHEWIEAEANVRFTWNHTNNEIHRAYISGSSIISDRFLVLIGDADLFDVNGNALNISGLNPNEKDFFDDQNWVYEASVKAMPGAQIKLTAQFNGRVQYFYGTESTTYQILGGSGTEKYELRIVYDFKTNRLVTGFIPSGEIGTNLAINADVMIIRKHQESAKTITFTVSGKLSDVKTVYGAMKFNKYILNNKEEGAGHANTDLSRYERDLFWISFPFDVKLNDVFGFGTYGKHWIIEYYDGKGRATNGYWADSDPNWKFVTKAMRDTFVLKANEGYILALDLDELTEASSVWTYGVENVYLYFPSDKPVGGIEKTSVTVDIDQTGYRCDIDRRTDKTVADINKDRRIVDSYWHCVGVPSYAGAAHAIANSLLPGDTVPNITPENWASSLPYIYEWNMATNKVKVKSASSYTFEPMHAYLVQYAQETIEWTNINATPQAVAARRRADYKSVYEFRLDLLQGENEADHTFISMRDNDEVTTGFDFNFDLTKNVYASQANIYTVISSEIDGTPNAARAAGNCLPLETEQVMTVPVGVTIKTAGEYTFAMPDGTEGMSVTLLDSEAGVTTDLSVETYQVELPAGTYENRFYMTIDPRNAATQIDIVGGESEDDVRTAKILRNGLLYIQRGDRIYDSTGRKLE